MTSRMKENTQGHPPAPPPTCPAKKILGHFLAQKETGRRGFEPRPGPKRPKHPKTPKNSPKTRQAKGLFLAGSAKAASDGALVCCVGREKVRATFFLKIKHLETQFSAGSGRNKVNFAPNAKLRLATHFSGCRKACFRLVPLLLSSLTTWCCSPRSDFFSA